MKKKQWRNQRAMVRLALYFANLIRSVLQLQPRICRYRINFCFCLQLSQRGRSRSGSNLILNPGRYISNDQCAPESGSCTRTYLLVFISHFSSRCQLIRISYTRSYLVTYCTYLRLAYMYNTSIIPFCRFTRRRFGPIFFYAPSSLEDAY